MSVCSSFLGGSLDLLGPLQLSLLRSNAHAGAVGVPEFLAGLRVLTCGDLTLAVAVESNLAKHPRLALEANPDI